MESRALADHQLARRFANEWQLSNNDGRPEGTQERDDW